MYGKYMEIKIFAPTLNSYPRNFYVCHESNLIFTFQLLYSYILYESCIFLIMSFFLNLIDIFSVLSFSRQEVVLLTVAFILYYVHYSYLTKKFDYKWWQILLDIFLVPIELVIRHYTIDLCYCFEFVFCRLVFSFSCFLPKEVPLAFVVKLVWGC